MASLPCWLVGVAAVGGAILLGVIYLYYRHLLMNRRIRQMCRYCSHVVDVISDCHHAGVKEQFPRGFCRECKQECTIICKRCKRAIH